MAEQHDEHQDERLNTPGRRGETAGDAAEESLEIAEDGRANSESRGSAADDAESSDREITHVDDGRDLSPEDERVAELMAHTIDIPILAEAVEQQEAADAADTLEDLEEEQAADILELMDEQAAAEALAEMEKPLAAMVIDDLVEEGNTDLAGRLLQLMAPDDAVDVLQAVREDERAPILRTMPSKVAIKLRELVRYGKETAAGLMTTEYHALTDTMTVGEATEVIRTTELPDEMHHLPVIDEEMKLVGIVSLRALLLTRADRRIGDIMDRNVKAIRTDVDREAVAMEFDRYDYFMLPVVDEDGRLLGVVTVDDVIDIIRAEQTEDVQKTVGAGGGEAVYSGLREKLKGRLPWLAMSLMLTCGAALVIIFFKDLVSHHPFIAFLMPVNAALVGNAGHQALAVTLRGIVLDEVRRERVGPLVAREATVGLVNGLTLGTLVFFVVLILSLFPTGADWAIGAVAGIALVISMCLGTLAGSGIPLLMRRLGADPAQSSAIFLIMITDAVGFASFLSLTYVAVEWLKIA
jgi:magnesium transporter